MNIKLENLFYVLVVLKFNNIQKEWNDELLFIGIPRTLQNLVQELEYCILWQKITYMEDETLEQILLKWMGEGNIDRL
jgi:hypothetical protein